MNPPEGEPPPLIIRFTKLECARRQIVSAVWLWFKNADIVSIHTITGAAFGILHDISQVRNKGRPIPFDEKYMPKGFEKEIRNLLRSDETFFKHARHDADRIHYLRPEWTSVYLLTAIRAYAELKDEKDLLHPLMSLYVFWFSIFRPELFGSDALPKIAKRLDIESVKKLSKIEFFEELGGPFLPEPPYTPLAQAIYPPELPE